MLSNLTRWFSGWETFLWRFLAPVLFLFMIVIGSASAVPAWTAHAGGGTAGTFTATARDCGDSGCTWRGDFIAADASVRRTDVGLGSGGGGQLARIGDSMPAVDTGDSNNIYPVGGGSDWILITVLVGVSAIALVVWVLTVGRAFLRYLARRRRERRRPTDLFEQLRQSQ